MKYALYLGCTIPARSRNYELSARKVAETVGVEFVDIEEFVCCGFPMKASDLRAAEVMGRDIAGVDLVPADGEYAVIEVNSAPEFEGFERASGLNVAREILRYARFRCR